MTASALYHPHPPGPLMARLFISFRLADRFVSYPRQEAPMGDPAAELDALYTDFADKATVLRDAIRRAAELQPEIEQLWERIHQLEAAERRGQRAAAGTDAG